MVTIKYGARVSKSLVYSFQGLLDKYSMPYEGSMADEPLSVEFHLPDASARIVRRWKFEWAWKINDVAEFLASELQSNCIVSLGSFPSVFSVRPQPPESFSRSLAARAGVVLA